MPNSCTGDAVSQGKTPASGANTPISPPCKSALANAEQLCRGVEDALWITGHAARHGIALDKADISLLIESAGKLQAGTLVGDEQVKFWQALQRAAKLVGPDVLDSWRHIFTEAEDPTLLGRLYRRLMGKPRKIRFAYAVVTYYRLLTILALFILLVVQVYWVVGWSITSDIRALEAKQGSPAVSESSGTTLTGTITTGNAERGLQESEIAGLEGNYAMLATWNRVWRHPGSSLVDWLWGEPAPTPADPGPPASLDAIDYIAKRHTDLAKASVVLLSLSSYLLPLVYGWIGALAYTLRSLETEIRLVSLRRVSKINYGLRVTLGALAGLAIGWFLRPKDGALGDVDLPATIADLPISSISAVALAFVAGYSVDLLFAALDRIVGAFGGRSPATEPSRNPGD